MTLLALGTDLRPRSEISSGGSASQILLAVSTQHTVPRYAEFGGITAVIASTSMRRLMATAGKVARTNAPVLITGESGTGKELLARAVHHMSPRAARPFIDINCAALPEHLIESELFGYERGAFSGADSSKPGLFESAQGGTIFLDEIGELELRMQAKLLRVLDGQPYFRLGGTRKVQADARIVAATNLEVYEAVAGRKFRRDLYHRLDAFHMRVPALRDRLEDIGPLADLFLRGTGFTLSLEALAMLREYSWPGNVRELKNVLGKATLFAEGLRIEPGDLPPELTIANRRAPATRRRSARNLAAYAHPEVENLPVART
jgi:transcriptional regulator with PAS, ATPase and Fis domain